MKNRRKRIEIIIDLINTQNVGSQEELADMLSKKGHQVTQATLSRDLKMLRTSKVATDRGTYKYILPADSSLNDHKSVGIPNSHLNYRNGIISLAISGNIAVLKTRNGYAPGVAFDIDSHRSPEIIGTIPGSDTILAILKEGVGKQEAIAVLSRILSVDLNNIYNND